MTIEIAYSKFLNTFFILFYSSLQHGLLKSICSSRSFSLKHMLRLRGVGSATRTSSMSINNNNTNNVNTIIDNIARLNGLLRLEATIPDISLQFVGVSAIPILSTPLSLSLFSPDNNNNNNDNSSSFFADLPVDRPQFGYVSLSQTRKAVLISEGDSAALSSMPVVGTWLRLDTPYSNGGSFQDILRHPMCWCACVRFLCSDLIAQRIFVTSETFLLVSLCVCVFLLFDIYACMYMCVYVDVDSWRCSAMC